MGNKSHSKINTNGVHMANIKDFKAIYAINNQANWLRIIRLLRNSKQTPNKSK